MSDTIWSWHHDMFLYWCMYGKHVDPTWHERYPKCDGGHQTWCVMLIGKCHDSTNGCIIHNYVGWNVYVCGFVEYTSWTRCFIRIVFIRFLFCNENSMCGVSDTCNQPLFYDCWTPKHKINRPNEMIDWKHRNAKVATIQISGVPIFAKCMNRNVLNNVACCNRSCRRTKWVFKE